VDRLAVDVAGRNDPDPARERRSRVALVAVEVDERGEAPPLTARNADCAFAKKSKTCEAKP
jgi:hypothetical protein